ncbi:MAG: hypothetical protein ACI8X5_004152, partial [Planctomycetota bacterium]
MMTSMIRSFLAVLSGCLFFCACTSIEVDADYDPNTNFAAMQSYAWAKENPNLTKDVRGGSSLISGRVTEAIEHTLKEGGYEQVPEDAEFLVRFSISVMTRTSVRAAANAGRSYGYYGGINMGTTTELREYEEGTLNIDFFDPLGEKLLWRGTAKAHVREDASPEESTERINKAV